MAKQTAIEIDGTIVEALSNECSALNWKTDTKSQPTFPVRCVCTTSKSSLAIK